VPDNHMPYYYGTTFLDEGRAQVQNAASLFYNVIYGGLEAVTLPFAIAEEAAGADLEALYMSARGSGFAPVMVSGALAQGTTQLAVSGHRSLSQLRRVKCLLGTKSPLQIAEDGGRHAGFLKNYAEKSPAELQKAIASMKQQIAEHQAKIANPEKFIPHFKQLDPRQQKALIQSKWPSDIKRQQEQTAILKKLLNK